MEKLIIGIFILAVICLALIVMVIAKLNNKQAAQSLSQEIIQSAQRYLQNEFRLNRQENSNQLNQIRTDLRAQLAQQENRLNVIRSTLDESTTKLRQEQNTRIDAMNTALTNSVNQMRETLDSKMNDLQEKNEKKLEAMRLTVDEKLQKTLETRLDMSFKRVSEQLESVYKGLGEMSQIAQSVGDLKRVMTNVKTRGTWGEFQLGNLLEQMLTKEQYAENIATIPNSNDRVEFAIKLPGRDDSQPIWLPIDSKFPKETYERLIVAAEEANKELVERESKALEEAIKQQAKTINDKYVAAPFTTDFGILFLPTEGLYAEVVKRPGLVDFLQNTYRINVAGPSTLTALLNSLQIGFKTLAIEKHSSEIREILGAVKTEFNKFGKAIDDTQKKLESAINQISKVRTRTNVMNKKLKSVEQLPDEKARQVITFDDDIVD